MSSLQEDAALLLRLIREHARVPTYGYLAADYQVIERAALAAGLARPRDVEHALNYLVEQGTVTEPVLGRVVIV